MRKQLLTALLVAAGAAGVKAQTFPATWGTRMQTVLDSVNTVNHNLVGITAAVYMPGYGLWTGVTGISSPGVPMDKGMRVLIGSNSKLFLAVTMLKLQEQGVLNLDDHIGKWIHSGPTTVDTTATIRQLLSHTSGMNDYANGNPDSYYGLMAADTSLIYQAQTDLDSAGTPVYPKGRGFFYSNSGYSVASLIIEAATGYPYWQVLRNTTLNPLNMDSTYVPVFEPYQPIAGTNLYGALYSGYGYTSFATASPGNGEIASTPQEMVEWYQMLFGGQVLTPASMQQLLDVDPASSYGLGIYELASPRLGGEYYHSGFVGAFISEVMYDKDTKASIFIALNTDNDSVSTGQYLIPLLDVFTKEMPKMTNDAGITALISPTGITCNASITPVVVLKNMGSAPLTATAIKLSVDGSVAATYNWTGSLATGASTNVSLSAAALTNGMHSIKAYTTLPNGAADGYSWNDTFSTRIGANLTTPYNGYFSEGFEGQTTSVLVWNNRNGMEGQAGVTRLSGYNSVHSMARDQYATVTVSNIDMPAVHLTPGTSTALSFRYAYNAYPGSADSLEALISTNCGTTWTSLFHKGGIDLSQGDTTYAQYFPQTASEWKAQNIPLSAYSGDALIRFRMYSSNGNNLYLDDIAIGTPTGLATVNGPVMSVYPNPAQDQVTITGLPVNTPLRLTDITGKVLAETVINSSTATMDVSKLTPGIYLLNSAFGAAKIVKQ